jgi:hypothetical protein
MHVIVIIDARTMCGTLCLQHKVNGCLWDLRHGRGALEVPTSEPPMLINFINFIKGRGSVH